MIVVCKQIETGDVRKIRKYELTQDDLLQWARIQNLNSGQSYFFKIADLELPLSPGIFHQSQRGSKRPFILVCYHSKAVADL